MSDALRYSPHKEPFRFIRKWTETHRGFDGRGRTTLHCEYEASFWEGPEYAGQNGRYARRCCFDRVTDQKTFLNTSSGVSYYAQLKKACGI